MKVYTIWNSKGGTGKTTTTINLAYNFMSLGKKVLVLDNDPQTNTTPFFTRANEQGHTMRKVYEKPENIKKYICRTKYKGISIVKGSTYLTESCAEETDYLLYQALCTVKDDFDIVLIDCRPSFEGLTRNAIMAADILLTPIVLDGYCRDNLALVERTYEDIRADEADQPDGIKWVIFANKVSNQKAQKEIYKDLMERHDFPMLGTCVSSRAAVISATGVRKPLEKHRKMDVATRDYMELAAELLEV